MFFNRNYYRVIYHTNEGEMENEQDQYMYGQGMSVLPTPTKEGYLFDGWYVNGKKYNFDKPLDKNAVLKAKWSPVKVSKIKVS